MDKVKGSINKIIVYACYLAVIWAAPLMMHAVINYLTAVYGTSIPFNPMIVDGVFLLLTVIGIFTFMPKFRDNFFVFKRSVHGFIIFCWHVVFMSVSGSVFYQFILAIFSAFASCQRTKELKLNKADSIEEINILSRYHMFSLLLMCVIYICSMLFDVAFLMSVLNFFNLSNIYLAALVVVAMMASACAGALFLFRVVYLNVANKIING